MKTKSSKSNTSIKADFWTPIPLKLFILVQDRLADPLWGQIDARKIAGGTRDSAQALVYL